MLDKNVSELARNLIEAAFRERDQSFQREIDRIIAESVRRGVLTSGITIKIVKELCEREVEIRAQIAFSNLVRVSSTLGIVPLDSLSDDLKDEVQKYVIAELPKFVTIVNDIARKASGGVDLEREQDTSFLNKAWEDSAQKIGAEIDLFVTALKRHSQEGESAPIVINFYGPTGVVQTGPNSSAFIQQTISPENRQRLVEALQELEKQLEVRHEINGYSREDFVAFIAEAKSEVGKKHPNMLKLRSAVTTIATTIQTLGALQPAYNLLKAALMPFGVMLP